MPQSLVLVTLLCSASCLNAQTTPTPELGLDVNAQSESVVARGWPLLIRVALVSANGQPVPIALRTAPWTQALQLTVANSSGNVQTWPVQLLPPASSTVTLSGTDAAEAVWVVAPNDTAAVADGIYRLSVTLDTRATAASGSWTGSVKSGSATVQLGAAPPTLSPEQEASKYLAFAAYSRLRGDTPGVQSALDTLISRQPEILEAYVEKADMAEGAGDIAGALNLKRQALQKFLARDPNPAEPVALQAEIDELSVRLALACAYTLSPTNADIAAVGGSGSVTVTATAGCAWTASTPAGWITLTSPSGSGNGSFSYVASANNSVNPRQGAITVANRTFSVTEAAATPSYSLGSISANSPAGGAAGTVSVTATPSDAPWTAASNAAWILVTSGASGTGNGTVNYSTTANVSGSQRVGTLTIAGLTFTITQGAAGSPSLAITKTHTGNFTRAMQNAAYTIAVSNLSGAAATSGTVSVADTLPSGLSLVSMSGTGWNCTGSGCTRSDALQGGSSYPSIIVTVNVAANAPAQVTNQVSVTGGGSAGANANDSAVIVPSGGRCDLNGDGQVDVADVQRLINMVLGTAQTAAAADLNGDGVVNVADAQFLSNVIFRAAVCPN